MNHSPPPTGCASRALIHLDDCPDLRGTTPLLSGPPTVDPSRPPPVVTRGPPPPSTTGRVVSARSPLSRGDLLTFYARGVLNSAPNARALVATHHPPESPRDGTHPQAVEHALVHVSLPPTRATSRGRSAPRKPSLRQAEGPRTRSSSQVSFAPRPTPTHLTPLLRGQGQIALTHPSAPINPRYRTPPAP